MKYYTLITGKYSEAFEKYVTNSATHPFDFINKWEKKEKDATRYFTYAYNRKDKEYAREKIAHIVSYIVQEAVLKRFATSYLKNRFDLTRREREEIEKLILLNHYMDQEEGASYLSYYLIYTPIFKDLEIYKTINIEGWVTFKTKQYKMILKDILEQTVYDYMTQKDYFAFILMLRENQKIQHALISEIHLLVMPKGEIKVLNQKKEDKTAFYKKEYCKEMIEEDEATQEDIILNILISVSPEKIILHNKHCFSNTQFIATLELVFLNQIEYCQGCELCQKVKLEESVKKY